MLSISSLEKECEKDGYTIIEYNSAKDVVIQDGEGYKYNTSAYDIKNHGGHNILQSNRFALFNLNLYCEKHSNGQFHVRSRKYTNSKAKIEFVCDRHPQEIQVSTADGILHRRVLCKYCKSENPYERRGVDKEYASKYIESQGGTFKGFVIKDNHKYVQYTCNKHLDKGIIERQWNDVSRFSYLCPYCAGRHMTTEEFKKIVKTLHPNIDVLGEYKGYDERIKCKCFDCGCEWETRAGQLKSSRLRGCPKCGAISRGLKTRKSLEAMINELKVVNPDIEYVKGYTTMHATATFKCLIHETEFATIPSNLFNKSSHCPLCTEKAGKSEREIGAILSGLNIDYEVQKVFDGCCGDYKKLRFDFYLPKYNTAIEFDGEQHFRPVKYFGGAEKFEKQQDYDNRKNEYCEKNNINLIRIPYTEYKRLKEFILSKLQNLNINLAFAP